MRALPLRCARRHLALMSPLPQEAQPHRHSKEPVLRDHRRDVVPRRPCGSFAPTPTPTTLTSRSATVLRRAERARLRTSVRVALLFAPTSMPGEVAQSQCHHGEMCRARRQRAAIPAPSELLFCPPLLEWPPPSPLCRLAPPLLSCGALSPRAHPPFLPVASLCSALLFSPPLSTVGRSPHAHPTRCPPALSSLCAALVATFLWCVSLFSLFLCFPLLSSSCVVSSLLSCALCNLLQCSPLLLCSFSLSLCH